MPRIAHIAIILATAGMAWGCPTEKALAPSWNPLGKPAYMTIGFEDVHDGAISNGIVLSLAPEKGLPALTPEEGFVVELADTAATGERTLVLQGVTGHRWGISHLSRFESRLEGLFQREKTARKQAMLLWILPENQRIHFAEFAVVGFSSVDHPNEALRIELRDPQGKHYLNPCDVGIACHDTSSPQFMAAATWDSANPDSPIRFTSARDLDARCIVVDPNAREPRLAFQVLDCSTSNSLVMGMHQSEIRQGTELLYGREVHAMPIELHQFPEDILWTFDQEQRGTWYAYFPGQSSNPDLKGNATRLAEVVRTLLHEPLDKAAQHPLMLEAADERLNSVMHYLVPQPSCPNSRDAKSILGTDSLLFTALGKAWLNLDVCTTGAKLALLDSTKHVVVRSLCDSLPAEPIPVGTLLRRWPHARAMTLVKAHQAVRQVALHPLDGPTRWSQSHLFLGAFPVATEIGNAMAWEQRTESKKTSLLEIHPKGLRMLHPLQVCLQDATPLQIQQRNLAGSAWQPTSTVAVDLPDSTRAQCVTLPEVTDLRILGGTRK